MLSPQNIADRLEELVKELFPGEPVYRELVPSDFSRPSTLIVQEACTGAVSFGCGIVELRPRFTLTAYVPVDEYYHSHLAALHLRQMQLVGLLLPGFIQVGSRAPKVEEVELSGGYDYDTVTATFSFTLDRSDFINIQQAPMMAQLHINKEVN